VRLDGRLVTPAQREAGRKAMVEGFTKLAQRVATANPPLTKEEVTAEAESLRSKFFEVGYMNPADGKAGNGLYMAVNTMATARQLLAENAPGAVDRARVMLNLTPHDPGYASMPEVKQYIASKMGSKEGLDQARDSGSINQGELGGLYRSLIQVGELTSATATPTQQAQKMIEQMDAITAWAASKKGFTNSGGYDATVVQKAGEYSAELRRVLALDDAISHTPAKEVQLRLALQNAKSQVFDSLPSGKDPVKVLDERREASFSAGERFADVLSAIPGPVGKVLGFASKEVIVGLRYASGDMSGAEALARSVANGVESLGRIPKLSSPGGLQDGDVARTRPDGHLPELADQRRHARAGARLGQARGGQGHGGVLQGRGVLHRHGGQGPQVEREGGSRGARGRGGVRGQVGRGAVREEGHRRPAQPAQAPPRAEVAPASPTRERAPACRRSLRR
jgi:hypothetical protein